MRKKNKTIEYCKVKYLGRLLRNSSLMVVFLIFSIIPLSAESYAQSEKLTIKITNEPLIAVFDEIEKKHDFHFFYDNSEVDVSRRVSVNLDNSTITEVLDIVLKDSDIDFETKDHYIILSKKEEKIVNDDFVGQQQQKTITGRVTDTYGEPLPGVTVIVIGTNKGTITDIDGTFTLEVSENTRLQFSFVGMRTQEVLIGNQSSVNIVLEEESIGLQEVVAIGYGTRMREELTGSISSISGDKLDVSTSSNAMGRLQGQVSGVNVTSSNLPGGSSTIRIRGLGTISDNDPLYVIDGVPVDPGSDLNPNDIESISILKDASSAAIYGTRGANGVVIITTKRGKENQKPRVSLNVRTGFTQASNKYDLLNTQEFGELVFLEARNKGFTPGVDWSHRIYGSGAQPVIPDYISPAGAMEGDPGTNPDLYSYPNYTIIKANKDGTDWYDEMYRNGLYQDFSLSVSGGTENVNYLFSSSYLSEDGFLDHTGFERFTFRSNVDAEINSWLKMGQSLQVSSSEVQGSRDNQSEGAPIAHGFRSQPIIPVFDIMGNYAGGKPLGTNSANPIAILDREKFNGGKHHRIVGNAYAELGILEDLDFRSTLGYNFRQWNGSGRSLPDPEHSEPNFTRSFDVSSNSSFQWNWSNTINYATTILDDHRLNVILGTEAVENEYKWHEAGRSGYFSVDPIYMQLSSGEENQTNAGSMSEWSLFSVFGRVNYDYKGLYRLEVTARRDGSSRFGKDNRYATFPAASFAWSLSEEKFMENTREVVDMLKLRLGWGLSGNDRIGNYNPYSTYSTHTYLSSYPIDGANNAFTPGFAQTTMGNSDVTWEKTETFNLGIDLTAFDNSFNFSTDIWQRNTSDMLYQLKVPFVLGNITPPFVNIGEMKNVGFDIELGYNNSAFNNQFRYNITGTISRYVNEIVKLSGNVDEEIIIGELRGMNYTRATAGRAFPEFYGYIVDGVFQTQEEADAHPSAIGEDGTYNKPGHFKYRDINNDNVVDANDRTFIGSPHPDFTGGLNIGLGYKNFDLSMFFYGSYGNEVVNYVRRWIDMGLYNGGRSKDALYKSWGSPYLDNNKNAKLPMLDSETNTEQPSTFYLEDASYLRLKNLQLSYSIPQNIIKKISMFDARVYCQVTNLFTITNYSGLDPEMNTTVTSMGIDQGSLPTPRQVIFGISLGF